LSTKDFLEKDYYAALGVPRTRSRRRSRRRTAGSRASTTLTRTRATPARRTSSRRSPRPTTSCPTRRAARSTTRRGRSSAPAASASPGASRSGAGAGAGAPFDLGDLFAGAGGAAAGGIGDVLGGLFGNRGSRTTASTPRRGAASRARGRWPSPTRSGVRPAAAGAASSVPVCSGPPERKGGTLPRTLPDVLGTGQTRRNAGGFAFIAPARECRGRGLGRRRPCTSAGQRSSDRHAHDPGTGARRGVRRQRIRLKGRGAPGGGAAPAGDLYVTSRARPHGSSGERATR
jgi:molecular chaperone DnaJ